MLSEQAVVTASSVEELIAKFADLGVQLEEWQLPMEVAAQSRWVLGAFGCVNLDEAERQRRDAELGPGRSRLVFERE